MGIWAFYTYLRTKIAELWQTDPLPAEMASGLTALGWSFILILPTDLFNRISYEHFRIFGLPHTWAVVFALLGLCQLSRILLDLDRRAPFHLIVTFAAMCIWMFVAASFLISNRAQSPESTAYLVFALASLWTFLRSGPDQKR